MNNHAMLSPHSSFASYTVNMSFLQFLSNGRSCYQRNNLWVNLRRGFIGLSPQSTFGDPDSVSYRLRRSCWCITLIWSPFEIIIWRFLSEILHILSRDPFVMQNSRSSSSLQFYFFLHCSVLHSLLLIQSSFLPLPSSFLCFRSALSCFWHGDWDLLTQSSSPSRSTSLPTPIPPPPPSDLPQSLSCFWACTNE